MRWVGVLLVPVVFAVVAWAPARGDAGAAVDPSWVEACLLRFHWRADLAAAAARKYPVNFGPSGAYWGGVNPRIDVPSLGPYWCGVVEHEERHADEYGRWGPPPWPFLRAGLRRLAADPLHPRAAETAATDLLVNPTDDAHLNHWLLSLVDRAGLPLWYGLQYLPQLAPAGFDPTVTRIVLPLAGQEGNP